MFAIPTKAKIAAGIAAGALTLGAAGAYAANANTITTYPLGNNSGSLSHNGQTLSLVSLNQSATLTLPSTFKNAGQCVSFFAKNKSLALTPTTGSTVNKSYHGKLMSHVQSFCATYQTTNATTAQSDAPDTTQSPAPETDSTDSGSGAAHANAHAAFGHSHGHGND